MNRELVCEKCEQSLHKTFPNENPFPGEHVKFKHGTAKKDFICDHCGTAIVQNTLCCAFSIWADYGGFPYVSWEDEFLNY